MEPNKFEEHIRTKLQERELQPSEDAWATLESQLGKDKRGNRTIWYAIAASLVAILVVGSFLLNDTSAPSQEIVFEVPQNNDRIEEETQKEETFISEEQPDNTSVAEEKVIISEKNTRKQQPSQTMQEDIAVTVNKVEKINLEKEESKKSIRNTVIAQTDKLTIENQPILTKEPKDFIDLKVNEVVAQVQGMNTDNTAISAEEIENLLEKAQREITTQRILNEATTRIDPASLLNDVETELERSFRDKVFDALGEGFNTVRTAVVERNN